MYVDEGIAYKIVSDSRGLFGGELAAKKAAKLGVKHLRAIAECQVPDLHLPVQAVVDYLGFRVVAAALLPINDATLQAGISGMSDILQPYVSFFY